MSTHSALSSALVLVLTASLSAQVTQRMNVATSGAQTNGFTLGYALSGDGRYVAFDSAASNLVPGDTNGAPDVFVHDRLLRTTVRVSVAPGGVQSDGSSYGPALSADGRYLAFASLATNLVVGDTNGVADVFVLDRETGALERISVGPGAVQADADCNSPSISPDGRFVGFQSVASTLVSGDANGKQDVFLWDRTTSVVERVSVASNGGESNGASYGLSISSDGRFVVFDGVATNLVPGDTNGAYDVFLRDRVNGTTERVSVDSAGAQASGGDSSGGSISADGRYVAFGSLAGNLAPGDTNGASDVFLRDRALGTTARVSLDANGLECAGPTFAGPMTPDAGSVLMSSYCPFVLPDTNATIDVFVRDLVADTVERVSLSTAGVEANGETWGGALSPDARFVVFRSAATNLVDGDTNGQEDVFVRDLRATGFTSLCDPGVGLVTPCPCANPPSGPDRGCDNSSATGGAALTATGNAYLGQDTLVFATSGEKPHALSLVVQGDLELSDGAVFGQGVRCVGGVLKRLYTKVANGGGLVVPDVSAGDPPVSLRSALVGDVLAAGASRFYLVYYRETSVLAGCAGAGLFNATQTGRVVWSW
ncbi:MAG: calcium-binding protein [Planctomycetota bacterium]